MNETNGLHLTPAKRTMMVIVLMTGSFCTVLNQTLLATAYPTLMRYFSITTSTVQWLTTGFLLVNGVMIPVSAYLSMRFNTKWLYIGAMLIFEVGTAVCACASAYWILLLGRLIQAIAVGITMPLIQTIMLTIFPREQRGSAMGVVGLVIGLAPAIGPTLSGLIIDYMSWRDLFRLILPIGGVVILASLMTIQPVLTVTHPKLDWPSVGLSSLGFGMLLFGFSIVGTDGWTSYKTIFSIIAGLVIVFIMALRQLNLTQPFLELRVFTHRAFIIGTSLSSLVRMAMVGVEMLIPIYLQEVRGLSALMSGLTLLPGALLYGLLSPITGRIFDRYGARDLTMLGMILLTLGTLPFAFINLTTPLIDITIFYAIRFIGISMVMMPASTAGMNSLPNPILADGTAVNNTIRQVAASIGTAILTSVLDDITKQGRLAGQKPLVATLNGYHAAFIVAVLFASLGIIIASRFKPGRRNA